MQIRNFLKKINRALVRRALKFSFFLAGIIPAGVLYTFVRGVVMAVLYRNPGRLLRNARRGVLTAFQDSLSAQEQEVLVKRAFEQLSYLIAEGVHYIVREHDFDEKISISGEETLKDVLARGKGVIAVTAHLGNFPLMMGWLARRGYKVNVLMRPMRDPKMNEFVARKFSPFGGNIIFTVPERECVQKSLKALRRNEVLFILIDQNYGADARVFVDFFGKKAATGASPAAFARRTGAGVVPVFFTRDNGRIRIMVEPEVEMKDARTEQEGLLENMQMLTCVVEEYVRRYPELWSWMHDRWKSRETRKESREEGGWKRGEKRIERREWRI